MKNLDPQAAITLAQDQNLSPKQIWGIVHSEANHCSEAIKQQYDWLDEKGQTLAISKWLDPEGEDTAYEHGLGFILDGVVIRKLMLASPKGQRALWTALDEIGKPKGPASETIKEVLFWLQARKKRASWTGKKPASVDKLAEYGRLRLSDNFWMRSFLHSEIADIYGLGNIPDDPALAAESGRKLCENVLEPIQAALGPITIRSAFRSAEVNDLGNKKNHQCSSNEKTAANHIWDLRDKDGYMGATTTIIVNSFVDYYEETGEWQALAWWIHDNIPDYSYMEFYPSYAAFNIGWHENPHKPKSISSRIPGSQGYLTKEGMDNFDGDHKEAYQAFLKVRK